SAYGITRFCFLWTKLFFPSPENSPARHRFNNSQRNSPTSPDCTPTDLENPGNAVEVDNEDCITLSQSSRINDPKKPDIRPERCRIVAAFPVSAILLVKDFP